MAFGLRCGRFARLERRNSGLGRRLAVLLARNSRESRCRGAQGAQPDARVADGRAISGNRCAGACRWQGEARRRARGGGRLLAARRSHRRRRGQSRRRRLLGGAPHGYHPSPVTSLKYAPRSIVSGSMPGSGCQTSLSVRIIPTSSFALQRSTTRRSTSTTQYSGTPWR